MYHRWADNVCTRCGVTTVPDPQGRPVSPGPCGDAAKRPPRKRLHRWLNVPSPAEDRLLWRCRYCGAEAESDGGRNSPGSHPLTDVFYRSPGGVWAPIEKMPACRDSARVPAAERALLLRNLHLTNLELGLLLGVPEGTARLWRHKAGGAR